MQAFHPDRREARGHVRPAPQGGTPAQRQLAVGEVEQVGPVQENHDAAAIGQHPQVVVAVLGHLERLAPELASGAVLDVDQAGIAELAVQFEAQEVVVGPGAENEADGIVITRVEGDVQFDVGPVGDPNRASVPRFSRLPALKAPSKVFAVCSIRPVVTVHEGAGLPAWAIS